MKQPDRLATRYALQFSESMRGLSVGAPVMLLGLSAGTVAEVGFDVDPITMILRGDAALIEFMWTVRRRAGCPTKFGRSLVRELITDPGSADLATAIRAP